MNVPFGIYHDRVLKNMIGCDEFEFVEDLKTCIIGWVKSNRRNEKEYWMYPFQPGRYLSDPVDAAKYRYQLRFRSCACGDWARKLVPGIRMSDHCITGCTPWYNISIMIQSSTYFLSVLWYLLMGLYFETKNVLRWRISGTYSILVVNRLYF